MSLGHPFMIAVGLAVGLTLAAAYGALQRQRAGALEAAGLTGSGGMRRHLPPLLSLAALTLLLLAAARPEATVAVPRAAGTVILAFDVSNSMGADDVAPTRLAAAQAAASDFVIGQPDTVDIGVVAFNQGALTTHLPSDDREATIAAINRLAVAGDTSLGQAIIACLAAIIGEPVTLPDQDAPAADLGYWGSATIVLLSDGEDTGGPDAVAAAELAAAAGVHIETIGVGTVEGTTIEVDGFQMATSLNERLLAVLAQTTTGTYHRADSPQALTAVSDSLELRITVQDEPMELTAPVIGIAVVLLTAGGLLMISWHGRII